MGETNCVGTWKIDTLNMKNWAWQVTMSIQKVQSDQKDKHNKITHLVKGLSLVNRIIALTHNILSMQVFRATLQILRAYDTKIRNWTAYFYVRLYDFIHWHWWDKSTIDWRETMDNVSCLYLGDRGLYLTMTINRYSVLMKCYFNKNNDDVTPNNNKYEVDQETNKYEIDQ